MLKFQTGSPSNMPPQHSFSQVPRAEIQRSVFDRSHKHLTAFDAGYLIPVYVDEVLPGDTFHMSMKAFARLATPLKPVMDNMFLDSFFFFVPYRLLWENWEKQCGDQDDPLNPVNYIEPVVVFQDGSEPVASDIYDYMGVPPLDLTGANQFSISAYPLLAYNLIWNEWFRDQNMQAPLAATFATGVNPTYVPATFDLQRRGKRHDYFTSCLPWPQKGPAVEIGLVGTASVITPTNPVYAATVEQFDGSAWQDLGDLQSTSTPSNPATNFHSELDSAITDNFAPTRLPVQLPGDMYVDGSSFSSVTINALREAFQLQRMLERDARGGTRYTEILRSHFGVLAPDARLQRPEYLGGGSVPVNVHPVAQTAGEGTETDPTPQGNLAAFGTVTPRGGFSQSFTEHGVIIGLVSARADLTYQQGLNKMWSRRTRVDRYWPALAHLGEQAVLNQEIFLDDDNAGNAVVFGYQERWAEYRYKPSIITSKFCSSFAQSLDIWHLSQEFTNAPVLGDEFIREDPPIDRVIAVTDEPHFIGDFWFSLRCVRPMPVYSVPGLIDHF